MQGDWQMKRLLMALCLFSAGCTITDDDPVSWETHNLDTPQASGIIETSQPVAGKTMRIRGNIVDKGSGLKVQFTGSADKADGVMTFQIRGTINEVRDMDFLLRPKK
jgi:hypothetical protein